MFKEFLLRLWRDERGQLDLGNTDADTGDSNTETDEDILGEDTDTSDGDDGIVDEDKSDGDESDDTEDTEEEADDIEEESEEEDEDEPEITQHERPTIKAIKAEFPDLFKKFPSLKDSIFREAAYTKVFPTIEDAQEAQSELSTLTVLRDDILNGDSKNLFIAISKADKTSLVKLSQTLLPALYEHDKTAYSRAVTPILENLLRRAYDTATRSKNEQLEEAALRMSEYLFDTEEIARGEKTTVKDSDTSEIDKERAAFEREKYEAFYGIVSTKIRQSLTSIIVKHVGEDIPKFARTNIMNQVIADVQDKLQANRQHLDIMKSRWRSAKMKGFDETSKSSIINTFLARARQLVPPLVSKYQTEWLQSVETHRKRTGDNGNGKPRHTSSTPDKGKPKKDYSKMSDMDILAS